MSDSKKEEIIIDVEEEQVDSKAESPEPPEPVKKVSFIVKFLLFAFCALLIYHLVTKWMSDSRIDKMSADISVLHKEISDLKVANQKLISEKDNLIKELKKTKTNLDYVDTDRLKKSNEIGELKTIVEAMKKDLPEANRLIINRLEGKIKAWEEYYNALNEALKKRPGS